MFRAKSQRLSETVAYNAYGVHSPNDMPAQRPAFNGHLLLSQLYLLGNGYRGYSPVLMRFQSPDSFSPFGVGGLNCYAYCVGDPINNWDPSGHMFKRKSPSPTASRSKLLALSQAGGQSSSSQRVIDEMYAHSGWDLASARESGPWSGQSGWNTSEASGQSSSQHSQAKIFAHASQLPTTSYPASNPASLPSSGGGQLEGIPLPL